MKIEPNTQSPNKVDMSLDDIIKLDKQRARLNRGTTNRTRGKKRVRVAASGVRPRSLGQRRSRPINQVQGSLPSFRGRGTKRFLSNRLSQNNRAVALAVLRRARQTAAVAAKTAADAAALLQRSRNQRQRLFDERRGINAITTTAPRITQGRRGRGNANRAGFRSNRGAYRPNALQNRIGVRPNLLRNRRQRNPNNQVYRSRFTTRNSRTIPAYINISTNNGYSPSRASNTSNRRGNRGGPQFVARGRGRGVHSVSQRIITNHNARFNQNTSNRNAEYLAQARALIRAQSEINQTYNAPQNTRSGRRNSSRRGLNYYAQFWDN